MTIFIHLDKRTCQLQVSPGFAVPDIGDRVIFKLDNKTMERRVKERSFQYLDGAVQDLGIILVLHLYVEELS